MMRPDRMVLSAYLDGEVPERFTAEIEAAIEASEDVRRDYDELLALKTLVAASPMPDPAASASRSLVSISRRVSVPRPSVWTSGVKVPLPVFAAAAALLLALSGVVAFTVVSTRSAGTPEYVSDARSVDVTIRVDGSQMDQVLQWLVDKNMLGEVNIELPESRFRIVGEPVLLRAADHREAPR